MKIHCNSSEAMIHSSEASDLFEQIILDLEIENKEYLLSLFKRVKAIEKVSDDELNLLYDFITSKEFILKYNQTISSFTWKREKLKNLEYPNMLSSFVCFMNKSKVIYILDLWADELMYEWNKYLRVNIWKKRKIQNKNIRWKVDIDWDNEKFLKFRNRWKKETIEKYKYIEFIDETDEYLLWIDLRSWMYIIIDKSTNEIIIKSKERLEFQQEEESNYIFVWTWNESLFLLYWNSFIEIKENIVINFIWEDLFLIDLRNNTVLKVWWKMTYLWIWKIIQINWTKITFYNNENKLTLVYDIRKSKFDID